MAGKFTRLTHKTAIQLHLVIAVPSAVLAPGGQFGNFWIHPSYTVNTGWFQVLTFSQFRLPSHIIWH